MESSMSQSQNTETLSQLLRHHGFFETLTDESIPLVSHIFSDFVTLKAAVAQFKGELVELREASTFQTKLLQPLQQDNKHLLQENNQLRLRVAELEDYQKDPDIKAFPPQPEPFPMRQPVPVYAEHAAMEDELNQLRKHMKEMETADRKVKNENERLKAELQFNVQLNDQLNRQIKEGIQQTSQVKDKRRSKSPTSKQQTIMNPDNTAVINPAISQPAQSQSITRSSLLSDKSVQQINQSIQTDEHLCFQCSIYQEQISHLNKQLNCSKPQFQSSNIFQQQLTNQNTQMNQLQQLLDQKTLNFQELEKRFHDVCFELNQVKETHAENETTVITTQMIYSKLEQKLQQQIEQNLEFKQQLQLQRETQLELQNQIGSLTHEKVKVDKTLQKMCILADDQKNRLKLNEGTIQRLDKANQTMSQYLSRLSLENQRLKRQIGIEE